jgi:hypothetical protein
MRIIAQNLCGSLRNNSCLQKSPSEPLGYFYVLDVEIAEVGEEFRGGKAVMFRAQSLVHSDA